VVDLQRGGDHPVGPARTGLLLVGLEQDAGAGRTLASRKSRLTSY